MNNFILSLLIAIILIENSLICKAQKITYDGYILYRCIPQTKDQIEELRQLMDQSDRDIEFWTEPTMLNRSVDIMVSPQDEDYLKETLHNMKLPTKVIMHDVGKIIKETARVHKNPRKTNRLFSNGTENMELKQLLDPATFYTQYSRYATIEAKLRELARDPRVSLTVCGKSFEGRNLYLVKVSTDPEANKPVIFIDAGHHAREWISHSTAMYLLESLIKKSMPKAQIIPKRMFKSKRDDEVRNDVEEKQSFYQGDLASHLQDFDFWFVPVVNPDGYEYTHTTDRRWRKTRSSARTGFCYGVDPNRNYPFHWNEMGASRSSCSDIYSGSRAGSEPEVQTIMKVLSENKSRIKMYLSLHAYSQLILFPFGYDRVKPDNYEEYMRVSEAGMKAFSSHRGTQYRAGSSSIVLYPAAGGSDDYAYAECGIRQAYTIELPDTGGYGFFLPPEHIIPVGQETNKGVAGMIDAMKTLG